MKLLKKVVADNKAKRRAAYRSRNAAARRLKKKSKTLTVANNNYSDSFGMPLRLDKPLGVTPVSVGSSPIVNPIEVGFVEMPLRPAKVNLPAIPKTVDIPVSKSVESQPNSNNTILILVLLFIIIKFFK